jgi:hypothetical protein
MGLILTVGKSTEVFFGFFAEQVAQRLTETFGYPQFPPPDFEPYRSQEVDWFGWPQLQQMAMAVLGKDGAPNLLSVEAWRGVFLPMPVEPVQLEVEEDAWLQCASLPGLVAELELLAAAYSLPLDQAGLHALWEKYRDDEDADIGIEMQTYSQLMLAAQVATARSLPLWVVK